MSSFDEWYANNIEIDFYSRRQLSEESYKAGAQSRQAEIEQSYKSGFYDGRNGTPCEVVNLQNEIDELQKRIDELLLMVNAWKESNTDNIMSPSMRHIMMACASEVEEVLKGEPK